MIRDEGGCNNTRGGRGGGWSLVVECVIISTNLCIVSDDQAAQKIIYLLKLPTPSPSVPGQSTRTDLWGQPRASTRGEQTC
jgi:hypothetical protein